MVKHFLDIADFTSAQLKSMIVDAKAIKANPDDFDQVLKGKKIAMIFEKPSTRTRISFEVGIIELGGTPIVLNSKDMQIGHGETIADTAKVLSRFVDAIMIRANSHEMVLELAKNATIPVINALTDRSHPCQIMADILCYEEHRGTLEGKNIAWFGDGNNVTASWIEAAPKFGFNLTIVSPEELDPNAEILQKAIADGGNITIERDPRKAAKNADCIVTDCWVSMGDKDAENRHNLLAPYQVNQEVMKLAKPDSIFMHCLPAHRNEEVTPEVIDGPQSVVFDEAENRLHAQKAILKYLFD
ncbi:MAG: ornithine carbamoyltransferase [Rhizobiales bacterium]|nr:ornithine carbamoyltransferase [Hyphomicrobiales bacterium]